MSPFIKTKKLKHSFGFKCDGYDTMMFNAILFQNKNKLRQKKYSWTACTSKPLYLLGKECRFHDKIHISQFHLLNNHKLT